MQAGSGLEFAGMGGQVTPLARTAGLVVTESRDEVLVYDTDVHHIHHLNPVTATIWRLCDGRRSVDEVVRLAHRDHGDTVDGATVRMALTKLADAGLLDSALPGDVRVAGASRRALLKRAAVGAAIPTIVSISAPSAAAANSTCSTPGSYAAGCTCQNGGQCASGTCNQPNGWWNPGICA